MLAPKISKTVKVHLMIWICKIEGIALVDKDALLHPLTPL